ncbi:phage tail protein I [Collinsella tanakaei]|uniref:phage tail protein I n=1 Tax=Collinsella tanakaei TaxID=626935 RepID=UPI0019596750|nr:phage tail protein I [Collinsella tanakaei]
MRLTDLEMRRLLPAWMQGDDADLALASGVDASLRRVAPDLDLLSVWQAIDRMPEPVLDELAWALDIRWYDSGASVETKRDLVLKSDLVHMRLGTVDALASVVASYFGVGRVREWFDYAGDPHHFKVFTTDPSVVEDENLTRFLDMLYKVKRLSSKFDGVQVGLTGEQRVYAGVATLITSIETHYLGYPPPYGFHVGPTGKTRARTGVSTRVATKQTFTIGREAA